MLLSLLQCSYKGACNATGACVEGQCKVQFETGCCLECYKYVSFMTLLLFSFVIPGKISDRTPNTEASAPIHAGRVLACCCQYRIVAAAKRSQAMQNPVADNPVGMLHTICEQACKNTHLCKLSYIAAGTVHRGTQADQ